MAYNSRNKQKTTKIKKWWAAIYVMFFLAGTILCTYGYAAVNSALYVSGEAVVKYETPTFGIQYMQEMTPGICEKARVGVAQQLVDKRDGKSYWVEKMANNACWMMQNLAFVITDEMIANDEINSETSDLRYVSTSPSLYQTTTNAAGEKIYIWNNNSSNPPQATEILPEASDEMTKITNDNRGTHSWSFGDAAGNDTFSMSPLYTTSCGNVKNIHECIYFAKVNNYQAGDWSYSEHGKVVDAETKIYDAHFNVGVHYQFNTIVAGSGSNATNVQMDASLCPKGWMMPLGSSADTSSNRSLYNLLATYGYNTSQNGTYQGITRNVSQDPIYMVRSGYVLASATKPVQYVSSYGYLWTGYAGTQAQGVYARISGSSLSRRSNDSRYYGLPARCVAR